MVNTSQCMTALLMLLKDHTARGKLIKQEKRLHRCSSPRFSSNFLIQLSCVVEGEQLFEKLFIGQIFLWFSLQIQSAVSESSLVGEGIHLKLKSHPSLMTFFLKSTKPFWTFREEMNSKQWRSSHVTKTTDERKLR